MTRSSDRFVMPVLAALFLLAWAGASYADIQPYSARYSVYRNGTLTGKAEVSLNQQGDNWIIRSEGSGTHGLARVLGARDSEKVIGRIHEGHFIPDQYSRHTRLAGMDDHWTAFFNWQTALVQISKNEQELTLDLNEQALDPLSLKLEMRQRLSKQNHDMTFWLVNEDEIDQQIYRVLEQEVLETSLGCLDTTPVERVRRNNKRYTRAWHAPGLDHVAVRIEHGKTDGNHMEMRITELKLDGITIVPKQGCSSFQAAAGQQDVP